MLNDAGIFQLGFKGERLIAPGIMYQENKGHQPTPRHQIGGFLLGHSHVIQDQSSQEAVTTQTSRDQINTSTQPEISISDILGGVVRIRVLKTSR